jgi:DNA-binding CsgD family transcriptional regulator
MASISNGAELSTRAPTAVHADESDRLAAMVLEHLDVGLVLLSAEDRKLVWSNDRADTLLGLRHGGQDADLFGALLRLAREATRRCGTFTPEKPITVRSGERRSVRAKQVAASRTLLLITTPSAPRRGGIRDILATDYDLTAQEIKIALMVAEGCRNDEIAARTRGATGSVKNVLTRIFAAVGVRSRTELVAKLHSLTASPLHS